MPDFAPTPDQMAQALAAAGQNQTGLLGAQQNPMMNQQYQSAGMLGARPPGPPGMLSTAPPTMPAPPPPMPPQAPQTGVPMPPRMPSPAPSAPQPVLGPTMQQGQPGVPGGANPYAVQPNPVRTGVPNVTGVPF